MLRQHMPQNVPKDDLRENIVAKLLAAGQEGLAKEFVQGIPDQSYAQGYADRISEYLAHESNAVELGIRNQRKWLAPVASSYYVRPAILPGKAEAEQPDSKPYYTLKQVGGLTVRITSE
jgi:hypothetical protein